MFSSLLLRAYGRRWRIIIGIAIPLRNRTLNLQEAEVKDTNVPSLSFCQGMTDHQSAAMSRPSHYILLWLIYGALNYSQGNNYLCVPIKDIYVQGLMQVNTQNVKLQCVISVMVVCTFRMYGVIWGEWWTHWLSCQRKTPRMIFVNFRFVHHLKHSFWLFGSDPMVFVCASNFSVSRYHH